MQLGDSAFCVLVGNNYCRMKKSFKKGWQILCNTNWPNPKCFKIKGEMALWQSMSAPLYRCLLLAQDCLGPKYPILTAPLIAQCHIVCDLLSFRSNFKKYFAALKDSMITKKPLWRLNPLVKVKFNWFSAKSLCRGIFSINGQHLGVR